MTLGLFSSRCFPLRKAAALTCRFAHSSEAAAWRWPPPELAPLPLRRWHDGSILPALSAALQRLRPEAQVLLRAAEGAVQHFT